MFRVELWTLWKITKMYYGVFVKLKPKYRFIYFHTWNYSLKMRINGTSVKALPITSVCLPMLMPTGNRANFGSVVSG